MDNELLCNFKKCRKPLSSQAWVTSCSHIFCNDDGRREFEKAFTCPACSTQLPGKYDIVKVDLNPSEQYKSMVLAGQRPEVIYEACSRAVAFWTYQVHQEIMFQKYVVTKAKQSSTQMEKYYQDALQRAKNELISLKENQENTQKDLDTFKQKTAELSEKLTQRVRQYQKLQSLYEALKRKCISPSFFEKQVNDETINNRSRAPFAMSTASEIICPQGRKKRSSYHGVQREFVLRPAHTPTHDLTIESETFNFPPDELFSSQDRRNIPPRKNCAQSLPIP